MTPQETDPDLPESVKESLKEAWVDGGLLQGRGALSSAVPAQDLLKEVIIFIQRRKWQPTPVFLPRESQGQRSLVGCSLWVTQSQTD